MKVREATEQEYEKIYRQGYREWAKGRSLQQYITDNRKEETLGKRYVLVDGTEDIIASLMLLEFKPCLFGIGSIVVEPEFRGKGAGAQLIKESMKLHPDAAFMLYSEIGTAYYERFGFRELPESHQGSVQAICMVRADEGLYTQILKETLPSYF